MSALQGFHNRRSTFFFSYTGLRGELIFNRFFKPRPVFLLMPPHVPIACVSIRQHCIALWRSTWRGCLHACIIQALTHVSQVQQERWAVMVRGVVLPSCKLAHCTRALVVLVESKHTGSQTARQNKCKQTCLLGFSGRMSCDYVTVNIGC